MTRELRTGAVLLGAVLLLGAAAPAAAADGGFDRFCQTWMGKLAQRERHNLAQMKIERRDGSAVGEYTGYARQPVRCTPTGKVTPGKPAVGTLVYHEIRYRKRGPNPRAARDAAPRAVQKVEVMEIFRFDGKRWTY